jgi:putative SOS response-associated peptidase YedK
MCGRFTLTYNDPDELAAELGVAGGFPPGYRPRYNIAPTDSHWIVRMKHEDREILPAKWGLVNSWVKDPKQARPQINARSETAERSSAFRDAFKERHCIVPADGFFEWVGSKDARRPIWFHRPDGLPASTNPGAPIRPHWPTLGMGRKATPMCGSVPLPS